MLEVVCSRSKAYNNNKKIAMSFMLSKMKLIYYRIFAWLYGYVGGFSELVLVNGTWTQNHIKNLWNYNDHHLPLIVFPPCDTKSLQV